MPKKATNLSIYFGDNGGGGGGGGGTVGLEKEHD